MFGMLNFQVT